VDSSAENAETMTDQERLDKNALCTLFMKEGIDGRHDEDAVARTWSLTTLAVELGRKDGLTCALAWHDALEQKGISGEQSIALDFSRANAIAGDRYGTAWQWDQPTLAREIFYLRRAVSNEKFPETPDVTKCMCLNNLGNDRRCVWLFCPVCEINGILAQLRRDVTGETRCGIAKKISVSGERDPEGKEGRRYIKGQ
jgi:hypothetical protein